MEGQRIAVVQQSNQTAHDPAPETPYNPDTGHHGNDGGGERSGFFISPLRPPQTREDVERAWREAE